MGQKNRKFKLNFKFRKKTAKGLTKKTSNKGFKIIHKLFLLVFILMFVIVSSGVMIAITNKQVATEFNNLAELNQIETDYNH
ncbi:MAG: hypothetical protein LRY71_04400, partial [Bacillaceae bacterium]|nr:hypothetical protein [Bacillaceae bacterium]